MSNETVIAMVSIIAAAATMAIGAIGAAFGEIGVSAMDALARQPDESGSITRTLFVSLAMVESTAILSGDRLDTDLCQSVHDGVTT